MLLSGKTALVLGVANRWSIAYAISAAYVREGAKLILTYQSERQKATVEDLGAELKASKVLPCDVTKPEELESLVNQLKADPGRLMPASTASRSPTERISAARFSKPAGMAFCWHRRSAHTLSWPWLAPLRR